MPNRDAYESNPTADEKILKVLELANEHTAVMQKNGQWRT